MKHVALGFVLLLCSWGFAQVQQGQPPPSSTPPSFPEERQAPTQQMPPETQAPLPRLYLRSRPSSRLHIIWSPNQRWQKPTWTLRSTTLPSC
jgi:hypothetical protein